MKKTNQKEVDKTYENVLECLELLIKKLIKDDDPYVKEFVFHSRLLYVARENGYGVKDFMSAIERNGGKILGGGGLKLKEHRQMYLEIKGE